MLYLSMPGSSILLAAVLLLLVSLAIRVLYALYLSPFSKIPGPTVCKISELPLKYLNARLQRNERIFRWHQKYGSVVLIAPGQVSFSSSPVAKEIYSAAVRYPKSSYFDNLAMYGFRSVFMAREAHEHRRLRKRIFGCYQPIRIHRAETLRYVRELAERACNEMARHVQDRRRQEAGKSSVDVFPHCNNFSFDNITRFCLGPELCSDTIRGNEEARRMYAGWEECELWAPLGASFPIALSIIKFCRQKFIDKIFLTGDARLQQWSNKQLAIAAENPSKSGRESLLRQMLDFKGDDGAKLPIEEIAEEILDNFFAAQSVVTNALVFLLWDLACHSEWQRKVREQLQALPSDRPGSLPSWADIESASILDASLQESSRVHPLASGRAERVVQVTKDYDQTIIPAGTIVSASTKALHYNSAAFPSPEVFDPARWLDANDTQLQAMKTSFMPYGQGARACIGVPFAMLQMKHFIASLLLRFEISRDSASMTDESSMEQLGTQSALPKGLRCDLVVRELTA